MKKSHTLSVALLGLLLVPCIHTSRASADPFGAGPPDSGTIADNSLHNYCFDASYPSYWENPMTLAMNNLAHQTDMSVSVQLACNSDADVRFFKFKDPSSPNLLGYSYCVKKTLDGWRCAGSYVFLNEAALLNTTMRQKTACHEVGHTVGLSHGQTYGGCMMSGFFPDTIYAPHHVDHINSYY